MSFDVVQYGEDHPGLVIGGVIVLGLGLFLLFSGGGSASAAQTTSSGVNPQIAAAEITAQIAANNNASALAIQQEQDTTALSAQNTAAAVANNANQLGYQATISQISASLAGLESTNSTAQNIATLITNEQAHAIDANAALMTSQQGINETILLSAIQQHRDISLSPTGGAVLTKGAGVSSSFNTNVPSTGSQIGSVLGGVGSILSHFF